MSKTIIVISNQDLWDAAQESGMYSQSTIEETLKEVGYIHGNTPEQTMTIANRYFTQYDGVILLLIDLNKVSSEVKFEASSSGKGGLYPHIYGPLNIDAIYKTILLSRELGGQFSTPIELTSMTRNER